MFDEKQIRIDSTAQYSPNKGIYDETPKTESSVRALKITPEIVKALRELKTDDDAARKAMGKEWNPTGYVFTSYDGGPCIRTRPAHGSSDFKRSMACLTARSISFDIRTRRS